MIRIDPRDFPFSMHNIAFQRETNLYNEWTDANRSS
jgi:hypothetical protein